EEERLARRRPPSAPRGDAAFEVEDEQVGVPGGLDDLRGEQRRGTVGGDPFRDQPTQHRVAGQRQPHHEHRCSTATWAALLVDLLWKEHRLHHGRRAWPASPRWYGNSFGADLATDRRLWRDRWMRQSRRYV